MKVMALPISQRILHVNTSTLSDCLECDEEIIGDVGPQHFETMCNHLIRKHGYQCFHIGQETERDGEGRLIHSTVAVFGK
jgi:hypothetical protein